MFTLSRLAKCKEGTWYRFFRTAQEYILISVNHFAVYLNIYLQAKLKVELLHIFAKGMVGCSWHTKRDLYAIKSNTTTTYLLF